MKHRAKTLVTFRSNLAWFIGNGDSVLFWLYLWVPGLGILSDYKNLVASINLSSHVRDFTTLEGTWDWDLLRTKLIHIAITHIQGIPPPGVALGHDSCYWCGHANRLFTVKSIYPFISKPVWNPCWKRRNVFIFQGEALDMKVLLQHSLSWAKAYMSSIQVVSQPRSSLELVQWHPPPPQ
ncbi:hypothetical protein V6N11_045811 [Hibiscus sabdariffa]|uniref:Reverse transcriptase zinc-binding domain-containing protein n=1 Tax=Hibiscus sabdariffa TaxID=183260 RepID=A0ABR2Q236_9ROSI